MNRSLGGTLFAVKQQADNALDIYIYDDIEADYYDWWYGKVESDTSANHIMKLLEDNKTVTQINVYINSYGGEVKEAIAIASQLKRHIAHTTAYVDAFCCSAAVDIALSCDEVIMYKGSVMMLHHASMYVYGNPEQLRKYANDLEVMDKASCSTYMRKNIKITQDELNELIDGEDGTGSWLTAEDCLEKGLCDKIADTDNEDVDTIKQKFNNTITQHMDMLRQQNRQIASQHLNIKPANQKNINRESPKEPEQKEEIEKPLEQNNFLKLQRMFKKESE